MNKRLTKKKQKQALEGFIYVANKVKTFLTTCEQTIKKDPHAFRMTVLRSDLAYKTKFDLISYSFKVERGNE